MCYSLLRRNSVSELLHLPQQLRQAVPTKQAVLQGELLALQATQSLLKVTLAVKLLLLQMVLEC